MLIIQITPSFSDTDMLGHVNNTVIPVWCETARKPIFEIFNPGLKPEAWNLIVARIEMDFERQIDFEPDIEVHTGIKRIGNSSFTVYQEIHQNQQQVASIQTVMVHFNYKSQKAVYIPQEYRSQLAPLLITD